MPAKKPILIIAFVIILAVSLVGVGYAGYSAVTVNSGNSITAQYGVASITVDSGDYYLEYTDISADSAYITLDVDGFSGQNGKTAELWLGPQSVSSGNVSAGTYSFGTYEADCDGSSVTSIRKVFQGTSSITDGSTVFTLNYDGTTLTVTGASYVMGLNFFHGTDIYTVEVSGNSIERVYRIIPVESTGPYCVFSDEGTRYLLSSDGGVLSVQSSGDVLFSPVSEGKAEFGPHAITGLRTSDWRTSFIIVCDGIADLSQYNLMATVYSMGED